MLTRFDDYPIHQMPVPIAQTGTSDRNHYDRYFFNGYLPEGEVFFGGAMGLYPNRHVIDAAFSIIHGGRQKNIHVSGRAPLERSHTQLSASSALASSFPRPQRQQRAPFVVGSDMFGDQHGGGGRFQCFEHVR